MTRFFHAVIALSATAALSASVSAQTIGCEVGGAGGLFPTAGTGGGGTLPTMLPPSPGIFPLTVATIPPGATVVTEVKLLGLGHTYINDLQMVLTDPLGVMHNLIYRPPGGCDFTGGDYSIVPSCGAQWAATCTTTTSPGTYDQYFGAWAGGTLGIDNAALDTLPAQTGLWTLTIYDWAAVDIGTLTSWELCFGTPLGASSPPIAAPPQSIPANGASLLGPTITLSWLAVNCSTSYEVEVDTVVYPAASTSFAFASTVGSHTWRTRAVNAFGPGPWGTPWTFTDIGVAPTPCTGQDLTTLFAQNNGGAVGGQVFFDVNVVNPVGINVAQLETNTSLAAGSPFTMNIYMKAGTFVGSEVLPGAWTLTATGSGVSLGTNLPSLVEFPDTLLPAGSYGVALVMVGAAHMYTGTGALPPTTVYSNADLTITGGAALNVPWTGTPFSPRMWNGRIRYNCTPPPAPFCFGDGTLVDHTTPCPCANNGTAGNGCANSANPNGANLATSGTTVTDNVVLLGSGMPATVSCIYLQGTGTDDVVFGDGVRCTGGTLLRLRTKANVGGASSFPDSVETITLSQRGGVTVGSGAVRYYQTYYRNSSGLFCPPETFNVTNGIQVTW